MLDADAQDVGRPREPGLSRALVVIAPGIPRAPASERPAADFVTHLIACDKRLPAYRRAGRAEPAAGSRSYDHRNPALAPRLSVDLTV